MDDGGYTGPMAIINIAGLSAEERLELLEQIWDSLSGAPDESFRNLHQIQSRINQLLGIGRKRATT